MFSTIRLPKTKFTTHRLFSVLRGQIPPLLIEKLEESFSRITPDTKTNSYKSELVNKSAHKTLSWLCQQANQGCQDSLGFIRLLHRYRHSSRDKTLVLEGGSSDDKVAQYFSTLLRGLIDPTAVITSAGLINEYEQLATVPPHSDGATQHVNVELSILYGLNSNGDIVTGFMELEKIYQSLSPKSRKILAMPIFKYEQDALYKLYGDRFSIENSSPILCRSAEDGMLRVNYARASDGLLIYEAQGEEGELNVKQAVREMAEIVDKMVHEKEYEPVRIKTGTVVANKNRENLHFKEGGMISGTRKLLFTSCSTGNYAENMTPRPHCEKRAEMPDFVEKTLQSIQVNVR